MVAIYTRRDSGWGAAVRAGLMQDGIPAILVGDGIRDAEIARRVPYVLIDPGTGEAGERFRSTVPPRRLLCLKDGVSPTEAVCAVFPRDYGTEFSCFFSRRIRFVQDIVCFRGNPLPFTRNEKRIIRFLLASTGTFFSGDEVAAACLERGSGNAVAVHVCNINAKTMHDVRLKMIDCRRYSGYRIP